MIKGLKPGLAIFLFSSAAFFVTQYVNIDTPEWDKELNETVYIMNVLLIFGVSFYLIFHVLATSRDYEQDIISHKEKIEKQHDELEVSHNEITDSIKYAKRIQDAMLPPINLFNEFLSDSFVLYKPKDVIAGDFYWIKKENR